MHGIFACSCWSQTQLTAAVEIGSLVGASPKLDRARLPIEWAVYERYTKGRTVQCVSGRV